MIAVNIEVYDSGEWRTSTRGDVGFGKGRDVGLLGSDKSLQL